MGYDWDIFLDTYLIPQIEANFALHGADTCIRYSGRPEDWGFTDFKNEQGEPIDRPRNEF